MILALLALTLPAHAAAKPEILWHEWYLVSQKGAPLSYFE